MVRISYEVADTLIVADTQPDLFSPKGLDMGSQLLLESVAKLGDYNSALDWGCGWGAIALWLAKHQPKSHVVALDSDIAAVTTTQSNALAEGIENIQVVASHGYSEVKNSNLDLICSNPPTHRGREVVDSMIAGSFDRLKPGGKLILVVEARIKPWVAREMTKVFGGYKILKRGPKNVVLMSSKPDGSTGTDML